MATVSPDTPLYNSRIFDSCLKLLKKKYDFVSIAQILRHAGMRESEVADRGHWFTQRQSDLFYEKMVQLCGNPDIARESGRYAFSRDALGVLRESLLALAGPEYLFTIISRLAPTFTRSSRVTSRRVGFREVEVTVTLEEGVSEGRYQCENRIGFFEAGFELFGYDSPEISHPECLFEGASVCRYRIRWGDSPAGTLLRLRRFKFLLLAVISCLALSLAPHTVLGLFFVVSVLVFQVLAVYIQRVERSSVYTNMVALRTSSEALLDEMKGNYDTALMINEIGEVISSRTSLDGILASVNQVLSKRLDFGRGALLLANADSSALVFRSSFGFDAETQQIFEHLEYPLLPNPYQGALIYCFNRQRSLLVNDIDDATAPLSDASRNMLDTLGIKSFICTPIVCEGESLGILMVDDPKRNGNLRQRDVGMIEGVAPVIGIAIRNAMRLSNECTLSEELRRASDLLERRVAERTAELSRANEVLEFLYDSVSHDLRTPLRVIYGYGELLLEFYGDRLDETAREYLLSMIAGGERMEATLNRMLDFSQVRLMALDWQPVDLSRMALRILNDLAVTDSKRVLEAKVAEGIVVTGDEGLLTSIMENLLGNAWKYTAGKPSSTITFGVKDSAFFVGDNGAGFDMVFADRLFAPFQRLHDGKTFAGHGLGLSMVRCMVERMGGKVWGIGAPGEGATFYFTIALPER